MAGIAGWVMTEEKKSSAEQAQAVIEKVSETGKLLITAIGVAKSELTTAQGMTNLQSSSKSAVLPSSKSAEGQSSGKFGNK